MADPYDEGITLKIKLTPRWIERTIFIIIISVLAALLLMGTFCKTGCNDSAENSKKTKDAAGAAQQEQEIAAEAAQEEAADEQVQESAEVAGETNETADVNTTAEVNESADSNQTSEANETSEASYSGNISLTINEVMTEIKNEGTYGKITGVRFTIKNEKENFMPLVEVYTYEDGESGTVFVSQPRTERVYSTLQLGKTNSYELEIVSQQFANLDNFVICKVVVKDKTSEDVLATATEKLKIT
jgi:hypothetical protein